MALVQIPRYLGKYVIGEMFARGGMGYIYRGEDQLIQRPVAIKFMRPDLLGQDPAKRKRFQIEAVTAARLVHPNLVTIYDVGEYKEIPYLVTQLIEGPSLRDQITNEQLDPEQKLDIFCDLAQALVVCHEAGIVHRDLKPSNVRMSPDGRAVLLDFGIAKMAEGPDVTRVGVIIGSVPYMAPEQARGEVVDGRVDLFSLGALMYQAYSSRKPFEGTSKREVILQRQQLRPDNLPSSLTLDGVPEEIAWIIRRLLQPNPEHRYPSARALSVDLEALRSALSKTSARAGERFEIRQQLDNRSRPWIAPAIVSAATLLACLLLLALWRQVGPSQGDFDQAARGPQSLAPSVLKPAGPLTRAGYPGWQRLADQIASGQLTLTQAKKHSNSLPRTDDRQITAIQEGLRLGAKAEGMKDPAKAYAVFRKLVDQAPTPIARAARRQADLLLAQRRRWLGVVEQAVTQALSGRTDSAVNLLTRLVTTPPQYETEALTTLISGVQLLHQALCALATPNGQTTARAHLVQLTQLPLPEVLPLALMMIDRLDRQITQARERCRQRLDRAAALVKAGDWSAAHRVLAEVPTSLAPEGERTALLETINKRDGDVLAIKHWEAQARDMLGLGAFDKLDQHIRDAETRFAKYSDLGKLIQRIQRQRKLRERKASLLYQRFLATIGQPLKAQPLLEELKREFPQSPWYRRAEKLWKISNR